MQPRPVWRHAVGVCAVAVWTAGAVGRAVAQQPVDTVPPRPASAGVYTAPQAERGREVFGAICQGCHNIGSQTGEAFSKRWKGVLLSELFRVMTDTMPKDTPGSLTVKERVDVIAYLLKINDLAPGTEELPDDIEQLKRIVIDLPDDHQHQRHTTRR